MSILECKLAENPTGLSARVTKHLTDDPPPNPPLETVEDLLKLSEDGVKALAHVTPAHLQAIQRFLQQHELYLGMTESEIATYRCTH